MTSWTTCPGVLDGAAGWMQAPLVTSDCGRLEQACRPSAPASCAVTSRGFPGLPVPPKDVLTFFEG